MNVALLQLRIEGGRLEQNRESAVAAIESAAEAGADLLVLPELWNVGFFAAEDYERAAEPLSGPTLSRVAELADTFDVAILAGSVIEDLKATAGPTPSETGLSNTSVLFGPDGTRRATYRKHHLFGYESAEADQLVPGERLETAELGGFTIGITTCYDLRFPALYRDLLDRGVTLFLVPSAWPYPRVEHWQLLPRARAVENLAYVAAANGVGRFEEAELLGRSTVYDPWGTTLSSSGGEPALVTAEADPERIAEMRSEFPALADRR